MPSPTPTPVPLDHPTPQRPHRVYATLTNHCNRACPWCSVHSSPRGSTFLSREKLEAALPPSGHFELQLEGGEPTVHPAFWDFVASGRTHPRCMRVVLCSNGVVWPREPDALSSWIARLGAPLTLKLSLNHYVLQHDAGLWDLAVMTRNVLGALNAADGGDRLLVLNVRRRKTAPDADVWLVDALDKRGLSSHANVFFLQRYGMAADQLHWDEPFLVGDNFRFVNPDGATIGPDLLRRSAAMRVLP